MVKNAIKWMMNSLGVGIHRHWQDPDVTLLGLRTKPIRTIIDVGANRGQFARYISKFFPKATIHSFEPLAQPYVELATWAETTSGRVRSYNIALGEKNCMGEMSKHLEHSPSSSVLPTTKLNEKLHPFIKKQSVEKVELRTLDSVFNGSYFEDEVFLKLDVQGYEDRVLVGGENLLKKVSYSMLEVNIDDLYNNQATFFKLCSLMHDAGLTYRGNFSQRYAQDGRVCYTDCLFARLGKK